MDIFGYKHGYQLVNYTRLTRDLATLYIIFLKTLTSSKAAFSNKFGKRKLI